MNCIPQITAMRFDCPKGLWAKQSVYIQDAEREKIIEQRKAICERCELKEKPKEVKVNMVHNPNHCPNCGYKACCGELLIPVCPNCGKS